jgi:hypothetical protein
VLFIIYRRNKGEPLGYGDIKRYIVTTLVKVSCTENGKYEKASINQPASMNKQRTEHLPVVFSSSLICSNELVSTAFLYIMGA